MRSPRSGRLVPRDVFRRLLAARDHMESRHAEPILGADVAAVAGISPFHFLRLFRQAFGTTPHTYLTQVRLEQARALLARGASVTESCFEVGYASLGSFSSLFARRYGASPDAYRRRVRSFVTVPGELVRLSVPCLFLHRFAAAANRNSREAAAGGGVLSRLHGGGTP